MMKVGIDPNVKGATPEGLLRNSIFEARCRQKYEEGRRKGYDEGFEDGYPAGWNEAVEALLKLVNDFYRGDRS